MIILIAYSTSEKYYFCRCFCWHMESREKRDRRGGGVRVRWESGLGRGREEGGGEEETRGRGACWSIHLQARISVWLSHFPMLFRFSDRRKSVAIRETDYCVSLVLFSSFFSRFLYIFRNFFLFRASTGMDNPSASPVSYPFQSMDFYRLYHNDVSRKYGQPSL